MKKKLTLLLVAFVAVAAVAATWSLKTARAEATGDVTALWDFQNVNPSTLAGMTIQGTTGSVPSTVEGIELYVDATNGKLAQRTSDAQFNSGTILRVPVKAAGDEVTVVSYPSYHNYTIGGTEAADDAVTYKAKTADATNGYVEIIATGSSYLYSISVLQKAQAGTEPIVLDNEAVTATFPFNLGNEGQKATFSNSNYFLSSKVTVGDNLKYDGIGAIGSQTLFKPEVQNNTPTEGDAIRFLIQPKYGFTFTPTKVSLKATRYGTDNGKLDIYWQNVDKTTVELAKEVSPNRNNKTPNISELSYDITGATAGEGTCGLLVYLYYLGNTKQVGLADIVIEGTLTGTEKDMPVLAAVTINGTEYSADDVFQGGYEGTVKLSKTVDMVSATNPVTATAASGEVGTIAYEGDATSCKVTIPMTKGDVSVDYVLSIIQKPDYKLEYIAGDGLTVLKTQTVEEDAKIGAFAYDINEVTPTREGWKARGWFKKAELGGAKYTVDDVITKDVKLYTVETEVEVASESRTYDFNLKDKYFYAEDHEAFSTEGNGKWHDATHGWDFKDGDKINLLVGPKATISVTTCKYPEGGAAKIMASNGQEVAAVDATDGTVQTINYEGNAGILTLTISGGQAYIHAIKIENTAEENFVKQGQWLFVKPADANSLLDALAFANKTNTSAAAERLFIFLPAGTYDLGSLVNTTISGHNISLIGESMTGTVIVNTPHFTIEGIGTTETLTNTGSGNYLQDLTLKNALDYYGAQDAGMGGGRAVCFWDKGSTRTIFRNVTMLSYQDTYYSNNNDGLYYFEGCDIHGTVDFFCGSGTMFVEKSTITLEKRNRSNSGGNTITAPATAAGKNYGYVFNNCTIENLGANYNFGRAWQGEPRCAYLNTTLKDKDNLTDKRWTEGGMGTVAKEFVEYNTMDAQGNRISPASHELSFTYGGNTNKMETILTDAQAAEFTVDKVFTTWQPAQLAAQLEGPAANYADGKITWTAVEGATGYLIFKNGKLLTVVVDGSTEFSLEGINPEKDNLSISAANSMGGFGTPAHVAGTTGISTTKAATMQQGTPVYYNLQGMRVDNPTKGIYIVNGKKVIMK